MSQRPSAWSSEGGGWGAGKGAAGQQLLLAPHQATLGGTILSRPLYPQRLQVGLCQQELSVAQYHNIEAKYRQQARRGGYCMHVCAPGSQPAALGLAL